MDQKTIFSVTVNNNLFSNFHKKPAKSRSIIATPTCLAKLSSKVIVVITTF